jgi:hypothetical protein
MLVSILIIRPLCPCCVEINHATESAATSNQQINHATESAATSNQQINHATESAARRQW